MLRVSQAHDSADVDGGGILDAENTPDRRRFLHWEAFDPKLGTVVVLTLILAVALARALGRDGGLYVLCAVFLAAADNRAAHWWSRLVNLARFATVLVLLVTLAWLANGRMWTSVGVLAAVALVGGLASGYGPKAAMQGQLAGLFTLVVLPAMAKIDVKHAYAAIASSLGLVAVVALAVLVARPLLVPSKSEQSRSADAQPVDTPHPRAGNAIDATDKQRPRLSLRSPVILYAVTKTLAVGISTALAWSAVNAHPFWATFVPMALIRPDAIETAGYGLRRLVGTIFGGFLGVLLYHVVDETWALVAILLLTAFLWFATTKVDYAVSVLFMTTFIVIVAALGGQLPEEFFQDRTLATLIGAAATSGIVILQFWLVKPQALEASFGEEEQPDG